MHTHFRVLNESCFAWNNILHVLQFCEFMNVMSNRFPHPLHNKHVKNGTTHCILKRYHVIIYKADLQYYFIGQSVLPVTPDPINAALALNCGTHFALEGGRIYYAPTSSCVSVCSFVDGSRVLRAAEAATLLHRGSCPFLYDYQSPRSNHIL